MKRLAIVGNGIAAGSLLSEIQKNGGQFETVVFGDEATPAYNRVLLSSVLAGEMSLQDISLQQDDWYQQHNIQCKLGTRIESINTELKVLHCQNGESYHYDVLVLATGAQSRCIDIPGTHLPGVIAFRTAADAKQLQEIANSDRKTVVLGGGLLGLEAAAGLAQHGADVALVHRNDYLMNRQLDKTSAKLLQQALEQRGVKFVLGDAPTALLGSDKVDAVQLNSGLCIEASCVVQAAGITPNTALAMQSGIECKHGILVDDQMQSKINDIYALGECCEHQNKTIGLVAPIREQADVLARVLCGDPQAAYAAKSTATQLKVSGIHLFSAGDLTPADSDAEEIVLSNPATTGIKDTSYRKLIISNNRLSGIVLYGDTSDSHWYFEQLQAGNDISNNRESLLFGQAFCA